MSWCLPGPDHLPPPGVSGSGLRPSATAHDPDLRATNAFQAAGAGPSMGTTDWQKHLCTCRAPPDLMGVSGPDKCIPVCSWTSGGLKNRGIRVCNSGEVGGGGGDGDPKIYGGGGGCSGKRGSVSAGILGGPSIEPFRGRSRSPIFFSTSSHILPRLTHFLLNDSDTVGAAP